MRLKSLHIKGFKSFANETIFHFNNDVIGIVGPNGSGKSNVVDAIRWALGEQKGKELRLDSMSDVIFNGTKTRKEAASAMVELTFDNDKGVIASEYQTVAISRTIYRSGESEYRLNNVLCRLKDIKSLLVDTGIGSNSYAIIALGMVDDLLADKEDSRRNMFEQAAGISKYKTRKKETLSKLNSTTIDLDRVEDLLFEIDGNMKMLEKQARRTKKYFELKEDYKQLSIDNAIRSISSLKEEYKVVNKDITEKQDKYTAIQTEINVEEAKLEGEKKQNLDKEVTVGQKQRDLNELVSKIRNLEGEKSLLEQKTEFKKTSIAKIDRIIEDNVKSLASLETEIEALVASIEKEGFIEEDLKEKLATAQINLASVKDAQSNVKTEFDDKTSILQSLQKNQFELEKDIAVATNSLDSLNSDIGRTRDQLTASQGEWDILSSKRTTIENAHEIKLRELDEIRRQEEERKTKIAELEIAKDKLQEELNKINRSIDSKQNEYDLLKSMIESFEGFPESIKFLATNWRNDVPILSDLLEVDELIKPVIEHYLEPYLNYYVVNDISEAMEAIKMLGGAQKGKANFFLLNKIQDTNSYYPSVPNATPAAQAIKIDGRFQKLLNFLLKDAYIFDGAMDDFKYDSEYDNKVFLSKSGTYFKTSATVSGGSVGLFEGKRIGRKINLERLEESLKHAASSKEKVVSELEGIKEHISSLKASHKEIDIDELTRELNQLDQEKIKANTNLENLKNSRFEKERLIEQSLIRISEFEALIVRSTVRKDEIKVQLELEERSFNLYNEDLTKLNDDLTIASENFNQHNIALIRQQSIKLNFAKDLEFKSTTREELVTRHSSEIQRMEEDKAELIHAIDQLKSIGDQLMALYEERKTHQTILSEAEQDFFHTRNYISEGEERVRLLNRALNQLQVEINILKDKFTDTKFKINAVGDRLNIEFNVVLNDIINQEADETMPLEELNAKVESIRNKLANYGEINPLALEAYQEIKGRFDSITVQRADILDAKQSLLLTIKELEVTATEQFMTSFEQVRQNFIEVFRSLFTEDDNCDLVLLQPENPLESEIEIVAKPKGKKPRSLNQLSGGEKTLTATALLFALYLLKPAPFCIFDEVDAPLDDANIQKFNKIIHKFSKQSQFIIVTHNKSTMAAVDVLYGVFMQEMGVSAVTEVDFTKFKDESILETLS